MMTGLFSAFTAISLLVLILYALVLSGMSRVWQRWTGLAISAGLILAVYLSGAELLGRAKPARLALLERGMPKAELVASHALEGVAIYLWLTPPQEGAAPRAYVLPWSQELAEELRKAEAKAEATGGTVVVIAPFMSDIAPGDRFSVPPIPALPPKRPG
jgi:hypothetical protein